jgi:hypothetical protein
MNTQDNPELKGAAKLVRYIEYMPCLEIDPHLLDVSEIALTLIRFDDDRWIIDDARAIEERHPDTFKKYGFLSVLAGADPTRLESAAEEALACLITDAVEEGEP